MIMISQQTLKPQTLFCGTTHIHLDSIDSTNSELSRRVKSESLPEGFLITASYQTSGRGYAGSSWEAEHDMNILMSLLVKPDFLPIRKQFFLNQIVALAAHDLFAAQLKKNQFEIKWPNDLVADGKKICGILIETNVQGDHLQNAICGLGYNINQILFPPKITATSFSLETGKMANVNDTTERLCEHIEARYLQLKHGKIEMIQRDYMERLHRLETYGEYRIFGKKLEGKIVGLNPEGKLVLDTENGYKVCGFKEVEFL
jgi:BirA family transcriptional regulator, biotin operon repressor / biotin---[acetyl-CoA-carboxylase] ligase